MVVPVLCLFALSCSGSMTLSEAERSKLDPPLTKLLVDERVLDADYDVGLRPDGSKEYGIIIRSHNVEDLRSAGIRVGSVFGDVITARVTIPELRKVLGITSVRSIQVGSKNYPH
jgi:hypothetical protein